MCSVWAKTSGCRCRFFYSGISVMSHRGGVFVRPISLSLLRSRGSNSSSGLIYFKIIYLFYSLFSQPSQLREEARQRAANQRKAAFMQWFSWRWSCSGHTLHLLPFITITEFFLKKILICLFLFISLSLTPPTTCRGHQGAQELLVLRQEVIKSCCCVVMKWKLICAVSRLLNVGSARLSVTELLSEVLGKLWNWEWADWKPLHCRCQGFWSLSLWGFWTFRWSFSFNPAASWIFGRSVLSFHFPPLSSLWPLMLSSLDLCCLATEVSEFAAFPFSLAVDWEPTSLAERLCHLVLNLSCRCDPETFSWD